MRGKTSDVCFVSAHYIIQCATCSLKLYSDLSFLLQLLPHDRPLRLSLGLLFHQRSRFLLSLSFFFRSLLFFLGNTMVLTIKNNRTHALHTPLVNTSFVPALIFLRLAHLPSGKPNSYHGMPQAFKINDFFCLVLSTWVPIIWEKVQAK